MRTEDGAALPLPTGIFDQFPDENRVRFKFCPVVWKVIKNRDLLRAAVQNGFDAVLTMDKTIPKEQYLQQFDIILVILSPTKNTPNYIKELAPIVLNKLPTSEKGKAIIVSGQ